MLKQSQFIDFFYNIPFSIGSSEVVFSLLIIYNWLNTSYGQKLNLCEVVLFIKIVVYSQFMEILISEFESFKDQIPEFVIKLYHILQLPEYSDYICWSGDNEILIKQPKRLEDKVLPHFFRHRHLTSFVRQLNMYKFNKIVKLVKEKNYMYFRNQNFRRGQIKELIKIKRNTNKKSKKNTTTPTLEELSDRDRSDSISIDLQLSDRNIPLTEYRSFIQTSMKEIVSLLKKVENSHPQIKDQLGEPISKCAALMEDHSLQENGSFINLSESQLNRNMIKTVRFLQLENPQFPSEINF